ncbi:hypothetical protein [Acidovorax sp.]|uniref:hypothetical protein n=1 Tax=Acidovorax sp. TaxID=1872122 RepID=UPI00260BA326|nr:hypothetical protein [Acidovorax sp.]
MIDPFGLAGCFVNFPDFPITVPGTSWQTTMTPGHAGALGYDSATGATRYYEYGRYDFDLGNVRRQSVPDLKIGKDGQPTPESMKALQEALSRNAGKGTRAELTCEKDIDEKKMHEYAEKLVGARVTWVRGSGLASCLNCAKPASCSQLRASADSKRKAQHTPRMLV